MPRPIRQRERSDSRKRVLIVDDHPIVRERLAELINQEPDLAACCEAEDADQALRAIAAGQPDVAIIDITLKDTYGIELIKQIKERSPAIPMLVLSMHDESLYAERSLRAGARGYITKQEATRNIITAIRRVLNGEIYLSERMSAILLKRIAGLPSPGAPRPIERLTPRELEVFELLGEGRGVREIAADLHISLKTVEAHREHIKRKLSIGSSRELLRYAIQCALHAG